MNKIKVTIKAKATIEYNQEVEMSEDDFAILKNFDDDCVTERSNNVEYGLLERYINPNDVFDTNHEFFDVEMITAKSKR